MKKVYIQFDAPKALTKNKPDGFLKRNTWKLVYFVLRKIFPLANPDFENKIDDVASWLVEIDKQDGIPEREIGLDTQSKVIVKMPDERNYGYWTDNNLVLEDFKKLFKTSEISEEEFEKQWASLE